MRKISLVGSLIIFLSTLDFALGYTNYPANPPSMCYHDDSFVPDKILRITARFIELDCVNRYSVLINDSIPGPELRFIEGDAAWIRVYNDMDDANVTIHWHGLTQRTSPFSDGTPAASQWPIPPGHYFDYEFKLFPGDAGTYFYHSHVGFQALTAFGALIVDEASRKSPFTYDEEMIILVSDSYHLNSSYMTEGLLQNPFRWSGEVNDTLINGKARWPNATKDQSGPGCENALITVDPNKTYRFRFIEATAMSYVYLAIEDHAEMTLIEVDGKYVNPVTIDHLEMGSGQRYSVLLKTKTNSQVNADFQKGKSQYWIQTETRSRPIIVTAFGVLQYSASTTNPDLWTLPNPSPLTLPNETFTSGWLENLEPLYIDNVNEFPTLSEVTRRVYVNIQQLFHGSVNWYQNGYPWFENVPPEPYLVSLYKNQSQYFPDYANALANGGFDTKTRTFPAKIGEVLEIVFQNLGNNQSGAQGIVETHPMHVHGDHVYDIGTGAGIYDPVANEARISGRVPIKRDTSQLYRTPPPFTQGQGTIYSWRAWRIRVRNPGVWMIHCHVLPHMIMGMQTVWVFGDYKDVTPLPANFAQGYLTYGGSAYGNSSYSPRVLHFWHDPV